MKKIISFLIAFGLILSFAACGDEGETPPEPSSSTIESSKEEISEVSAPPESSVDAEFVENEAFYRNVLIIFGAKYAEGSTDEKPLLVTTEISLMFNESISDFAAVSQMDYYTWYLTRVWQENLSYEELQKKYHNPLGEDMGWFFPEEYFEPMVQKYFSVSTEYLRANPNVYNVEHKGYTVDGSGGVGENPAIVIGEVEVEGNIRRICFTLNYDYQPKVKKVLTIEMGEDGEFKFISFTSA